MTKNKRSPRRMKDLASKKLSEKQAKDVRGGGGTIQKIRGANPGAQACDAGSKDA